MIQIESCTLVAVDKVGRFPARCAFSDAKTLVYSMVLKVILALSTDHKLERLDSGYMLSNLFDFSPGYYCLLPILLSSVTINNKRYVWQYVHLKL